MEVRCKVDESIAGHQRECELQKASFDVEVNYAQAQAELATELQVGDALFGSFIYLIVSNVGIIM